MTDRTSRSVLGSWLLGPGSLASSRQGATHPGARWGLPPEGEGSLAGVGIRLAAFTVDAIVANLLAYAVFGDPSWVTVLFAGETLLLTTLIGGSAGHRLCKLRVLRLDGRRVGVGTAVIRTAFIVALIPVLIWDRDGRGLHDRTARTVLVRSG
jgi:uncharacterized RDD family membrane protein YckC